MNSAIISNELTHMVNFPTRIPDCDSHTPALFDLFLSSEASICSTMAFPPLGNSVHVVVSVSIYFPSSYSQWDAFSAACAAAMVHTSHFFRLYQRNKSTESKVKFRQASGRCKRVLEAAKLAYANKTKESITSQKLGSRNFC